jgi:hypothetical protein
MITAMDERLLQYLTATGHSSLSVLASMLAWVQLLVPDQAASVPVVVWALLLPGEVLPAVSLLLAALGWIVRIDRPDAAAPAKPA